MARYIVTFEPVGTNAYETIRARLKLLAGYCPINVHSWAVRTDKTAVELRDFLSSGLPTSRIFVIRSGTEAAWINSYGEKKQRVAKEESLDRCNQLPMISMKNLSGFAGEEWSL
jgi:hypothetical protein